jgi:hypothetical protein
MKKLAIIIGTLILIFLPINDSFAGKKDVGTKAGVALKLCPTAKTAGIGETYVGLAEGIFALHYNPAGLSTLEGMQFSYTHNEWLVEIDYEYIAMGMALKGLPLDGLGASITYLHMAEMEVTTKEKPEGTGEKFSSSILIANLGAAKKIMNTLSVGANLKLIRENLYKTAKNSAVAFDVGLLMTPIKNLKVGACIKNVGTKIGDDSLPVIVKAGISYNPPVKGLTVLADFGYPNDNEPYVHIGVEQKIDMLSIRLGYKTEAKNQEYKNVKGPEGLTVGMGFAVKNITLDYAYISYGELSDTHRVTLGFKF